MEFSLQMLGLYRLLAGQHLVGITFDRIDFTVMYQETIGMCTLPAGHSVRRETGVNQCDGTLVVLTLQIQEEGTKLSYQKHTFINQGTAGTGYHIGVLDGLFEHTSCDVKLPVEIQSFFHILRFLNKCLHNTRHLLQCFTSQHLRIGGYLSPSKEVHAFLLYDDLEHFLRLVAFQLILGKEKHSDTVFSLPSKLNTKLRTLFREKFMGNLNHDTNTVSGLAFRILAGAVFQILYNAQCIFYRLVRFDAFNIYDSADTAVVMFKARVIHSRSGTFLISLFVHKLYLSFLNR